MTESRRTTALQDSWEATKNAIDALSDREDEDFPSPPEHPERTCVPAEFYFGPSLVRAAQELDLLLAIEGRTPPTPAHSAQNDEWLSEVARELEWIRNHPPIWSQPLRCIICGITEAAGSGTPRNDGRPRESGIAPTFRPGVGMTTAHIGPCPTTTQPETQTSKNGDAAMVHPTISGVDHRRHPWHPITREFAHGTHGTVPSPSSIETVHQIMTNVIQKTTNAEYSVDSRGCLSFEATLRSGLFIMCEVTIAGNINAGL